MRCNVCSQQKNSPNFKEQAPYYGQDHLSNVYAFFFVHHQNLHFYFESPNFHRQQFPQSLTETPKQSHFKLFEYNVIKYDCKKTSALEPCIKPMSLTSPRPNNKRTTSKNLKAKSNPQAFLFYYTGSYNSKKV